MNNAFSAHGVVLLAAGASIRLGRAKQLLLHDGETLVRRAARLAIATAPRDAAIVTGAHAEAVHAQVADLPLRRIDCPDWRTGMGASLHAGVSALTGECAGVLVLLCDQPRLDVAHLIALRDLWRRHPERGAASRYAQRAGVPALLPRGWFAALDAHGDRGARDLLTARREDIDLIVNEALALDIDTPADLALLG